MIKARGVTVVTEPMLAYTCEGCGERSPAHHHHIDLFDVALELGWTVETCHPRVLCPGCVEDSTAAK